MDTVHWQLVIFLRFDNFSQAFIMNFRMLNLQYRKALDLSCFEIDKQNKQLKSKSQIKVYYSPAYLKIQYQ